MLNIKEMIKDIEEDYICDSAKIDTRYALSKLWDNYDDSDPDEEMLLYNLIIAYFNVKSGEVTDGQRKCIKEVIRKYDEDSQMVNSSLNEEDNKGLLEMVTYIKEHLKA
mgnify:CR=1 FL=1